MWQFLQLNILLFMYSEKYLALKGQQNSGYETLNPVKKMFSFKLQMEFS